MRSLILWRLLAAFFLVPALVGCGPAAPDKLFASAQQHLDQGDVASAVIEGRELVNAKPKFGPGRLLLGNALLASGNLDGAEAEFARAESFGVSASTLAAPRAALWLRQGRPELVVQNHQATQLSDPAAQAHLQTLVAQALRDLGRSDEAARAVAGVLASSPGFGPALTLSVRLTADRGDRDAALAELATVLAKAPSHAPAWVLQADLLARSEPDLERAAAAYRQALQLRPRLAEAHGGLINVLLQQRQMPAAITQSAAMSKALPGNPAAVYFEALVAFHRNDLVRAQELTDRLVDGVSANAQTQLLAGVTQAALGNNERAELLLTKAIALAPQLAEPRTELARLQLRRGDPAGALETLKPWLESGRQPDAALLAVAAQVHARLGDFRTAGDAVASAAKLRPGDSGIRAAAAKMQIQQGRTDSGLRELEATAQADVDAIESDIALVAAHMRRNDSAAALKALDAAARKQPAAPLIDFLRGKIAEQAGDLAGARAAYQAALAKKANFRQAVDGLATLDMAELKFAEARQRYEDLLKKQPKATWAMLALADVTLRGGEPPSKVVALIDQAVRADPSDVNNWLGALLLQRGLGDGAAVLARAEAANAAVRDHPQLLQQLAAAQSAVGSHQQAITNLRRLVALQPESADNQLQLAAALGAAGNLEAARAPLAKALELQPDAAPVVRMAMALALQDRQVDRALQLARGVQRRQSADPKGWQLEAEFEARRNNPVAAAAAWRTALAKRPLPQTAMGLHAALAATDLAQAQQFGTTWLKEHPKDALFLVYLAERATAAGNLSEAASKYRQALQLVPSDALVQNNLANVLMAQGQHAEAMAVAQSAARLAPHSPAVLDTLAAAHGQAQQWPQALGLQQRAVSLQPQDDGYRLRLARLLVASGDKDRARGELTRVIRPGARSATSLEAEKLLREIGG